MKNLKLILLLSTSCFIFYSFAQTEFEDVTVVDASPSYSSSGSSITNVLTPMRRLGPIVLGNQNVNDINNFQTNPFDFSAVFSRKRFLNSNMQIIGNQINFTNEINDATTPNIRGGALATYINYENIGFTKANLSTGGASIENGNNFARQLYGVEGNVFMNPNAILESQTDLDGLGNEYCGGRFSATVTQNIPDGANVQTTGIYTELNSTVAPSSSNLGFATALLASDNTEHSTM